MSADRLDLIPARDTLTPTYHAVLRCQQEDGYHLTLENLTPLLLPQTQRTDLILIVTLDEQCSALWKISASCR